MFGLLSNCLGLQCRGTQYAICHEAFSCKRAFRARYWRSQELSRDPSRDAPASPKVQPGVRRNFSALLSDSPNGGPANMKCCHCTDEPIGALIFHLSPARGAATPHRNVGRLVGLTTIVSQDIHKPALHQGWPHPRAARKWAQIRPKDARTRRQGSVAPRENSPRSGAHRGARALRKRGCTHTPLPAHWEAPLHPLIGPW